MAHLGFNFTKVEISLVYRKESVFLPQNNKF